ncbi:MAG: hypothetical protein AAGH76_10115 [Pseudomonadota bacterium]
MSKQLPTSAKGSRPRFFDAEGVDELLSMVLELTSELATLRERQYVTERVLADSGIDIREKIEAYQPDETASADLDALRERLLTTVMRSLSTTSDDADAVTVIDANTDRAA